MRQIRAWWHVFRAVGGGIRAGRQFDQICRFHILTTLDSIGFFKYLCDPRTYGEILSEFHFVQGGYTTELMSTLVSDPQHVLLLNDEHYANHPEFVLPNYQELIRKTDRRIRPMISLAEVLSQNILGRLRAEDVGVREYFEREDNRVVNMFHQILGVPIYSKFRSAVFAFLSKREQEWLYGKKLLDVGCGTGRETAEIWLRFGGDIQITAIDTVPSMVEMADQNFENILHEIDPNHPPVTESNRPIFETGNALDLPFDDNSFDCCFWAIMLHWTSNPRQVIKESARVVRPGGLVIGAQAYKPNVNPYLNLIIRSSRNSYGFTWKEDLLNWFKDQGLQVEMATPAGIFRAKSLSDSSLNN